jgi:hypothetical protein
VIIYEPRTWDLAYAGDEVNCCSAMVCNPDGRITPLFAYFQMPEEDV